MMKITTIAAGALTALVAFPALAAERIALVERALTDATIRTGGKGDAVGNLLTWANLVYDADNKVKLGSDQGFCVRVVVNKSWECVWTTILKDGQITVEGPFADTGDSLFVITGGTGKYAGAKGQMKLHPRDANGSAYDFVYELL
jgi:allene oxide cyclase